MTNGNRLWSVCLKGVHEDEKSKSGFGDEATEFEDAIAATGYGKFNILLLLVAIPSTQVIQFESTSLSYVFTAAQCDLNLSLADKGILNATSYIGMVCSCFFSGFIIDTFGRKKIIIIGYVVTGVITVLCAFTQSYEELMVYKFLGGFVTAAPYGAFPTYLSEFHGKKYRSRVLLFNGSLYGFGNMLLPLLASGILPLKINYPLFGGGVIFRSWNLYILISSIPGLVAGITFIFLPETPKFLMTKGENEKALEVLRTVYTMNTGQPKETYPVTHLVDERQGKDSSDKKSNFQMFKDGCKESINPLMKPPNTKYLVVLSLMMLCLVSSINSLRLWLPQLFSAIDSYQITHNGTSGSLCDMLENIKSSEDSGNGPENCTINVDNFSMYFNSMVVGGVAVVSYAVAGFIINSVSKRILLPALALISGTCVMSVYFAKDVPTILALTSINLAFANVAHDTIITIITVLFPTSLRSMAILIPVMFGRISSVFGNIVFPYLLKTGCGPPFIFLGSEIIGAAILSCFLPDTTRYNMK